jgi:translation initiation factor 2B subunit (eIF-2B alpha/beta/delta family)
MGTVEAGIAAIARDRRSGSSALLGRGVDLLRRVGGDREALAEASAKLCSAQPAMAGFRTLAALMRAAPDPAAAIDRFALQIARAPAAVARHAVSVLQLRAGGGPLRLVTCSASQTVEAAIEAAAAYGEIVACCAEARPVMEGRDLAARLAGAGITTELYTDAGIGAALPGAECVLVGADAVGPESFINKVGTGALCALAQSMRVPVYVLAGREKVLSAADLAALELSGGPGAEVWAEAPTGVAVRNPYFEVVSFSHVSAVVTDTSVQNISV